MQTFLKSHILLFSHVFSYECIIYISFIYTAASGTVINDVTVYVTHSIVYNNVYYSL